MKTVFIFLTPEIEWERVPVVLFTRQYGHRFAIHPAIEGGGFVASSVQAGLKVGGSLARTPRECLRKLNRYLNEVAQVPDWSLLVGAELPPRSKRGHFLKWLAENAPAVHGVNFPPKPTK